MKSKLKDNIVRQLGGGLLRLPNPIEFGLPNIEGLLAFNEYLNPQLCDAIETCFNQDIWRSIGGSLNRIDDKILYIHKSGINKVCPDILLSDEGLAGRMWDYNLRQLGSKISYDIFNINNSATNNSKGIINALKEDIREFLSNEQIKEIRDKGGTIEINPLIEITNFELYGLNMAYLASHGDDARFLTQIPYNHLEKILCSSMYDLACHGENRRVMMGFPKQDRGFDNIPLQLPIKDCVFRKIKIEETPENGYILNPEYVALREIIKNAIDFEQSPIVNIKNIGENTIIKIEDDGPGILDEQGLALPLERFPEIFVDFTTTGSGLGLKLSKRFVELRGGYLEVITKTEGNPAIKYDTRGSQGSIVKDLSKQGTTFVIYIPN